MKSGDYYELFVETVTVDLNKLHAAAKYSDLVSLAQIAHRLKGLFAVLGIEPGKQLCETLELHITQGDELDIKDSVDYIDSFIYTLLYQDNS